MPSSEETLITQLTGMPYPQMLRSKQGFPIPVPKEKKNIDLPNVEIPLKGSRLQTHPCSLLLHESHTEQICGC